MGTSVGGSLRYASSTHASELPLDERGSWGDSAVSPSSICFELTAPSCPPLPGPSGAAIPPELMFTFSFFTAKSQFLDAPRQMCRILIHICISEGQEKLLGDRPWLSSRAPLASLSSERMSPCTVVGQGTQPGPELLRDGL